MKRSPRYQAIEYTDADEDNKFRIELTCGNCGLTRAWHVIKGTKINPSRLQFLICPVCMVKGMLHRYCYTKEKDGSTK